MSRMAGAIEPGMPIEPWRTAVSRERQRRYHDAAEMQSGLFADCVDLSVLANDTILATRYLKTEAVDGLHAGQRMVQTAPVRFDEPLTLHGQVAEQWPVRKGSFVVYAFDFVTDDGRVPVRGELRSFQVDKAAMSAEGGGAARAFAPEPWTVLFGKHPTARRVMDYSFEFPDYLVHFDPAEAAAVGLKAPVAQGLMSLTWMMEAVARDGQPRELDIEAEFRSPIFWDDQVEVQANGDSELLVAKDGGVCSRGTILHLAR